MNTKMKPKQVVSINDSKNKVSQREITMNQKTIDIFELPTHPAADVSPMLPDDELEELAQDIATNGLQQPLVIAEVDNKTVLLDGRNRREACRRIGVEPQVIELNGQDPTAFILSANINRRHLSKGQRAMALALIYPNPARGRGKKDPIKGLENNSFSFVKKARVVLKHASDLSSAILDGSLSLNAAYKQARHRKQEAENYQASFDHLKKEAPDLADMVTEAQMSLSEALAALDQREKEQKQKDYDFARQLYKLENAGHHFLNQTSMDKLLQFVRNKKGIYEEYSKRPISGLIENLKVIEANISKVTKALEEIKR